MIETTIKEIGGARFYTNIRILEPDDTIGGLPVHYIPDRIAFQDPEFMKAIKVLGLRRVGRNPAIRGGSDTYAQFPIPFIGIKIVQALLKIYWRTIDFLYSEVRFFKEIPPAECFSWRYFTPYTWYKKIK